MKGLDPYFFFRIADARRTVSEGDMLVAQPFLNDTCFRHSVITLIDFQADEGATGTVLNKGVSYRLADVIDGVAPGIDIPVYCGGPLSLDRLYFMHTLGDSIIPGARRCAPGLWVGGDFSSAIDYVNDGYPVEGQIRFFVGYSGWEPGQLEKELEEDSWAVLPAAGAAGLLSLSEDVCWHTAVRRLGSAYRAWRLVPDNLRAN